MQTEGTLAQGAEPGLAGGGESSRPGVGGVGAERWGVVPGCRKMAPPPGSREGPPSGSTTRPRMESASMVTSRRTTARAQRQTCRRVSGGRTPGAGDDMEVQEEGAQLSEVSTAAQALSRLSLRRGEAEYRGIHHLGATASTGRDLEGSPAAQPTRSRRADAMSPAHVRHLALSALVPTTFGGGRRPMACAPLAITAAFAAAPSGRHARPAPRGRVRL